MYGDLDTLNDGQSEHSDDDIVNNLDDLEHSEVEETPNVNNDNDADSDAERGETENKDEERRKVGPKKRRVLNPQPKLNEERLKGPRGIGVIEKMFEDVKLKGKGHEKEDLDLVMGRLEHWAHRLFPKFQFDDCLQRIEKLGSKRPVATYVKRLRMGMEDEMVNEIIEPPSPLMPSVDSFDELIGRQEEPPPQIAKKPITLTAEQRERMLRNRMLAEERRMARLQAQKERDAQTNKNIDKEGNCVSSLNISEDEQMDMSQNNREQQSEDAETIEASSNIERNAETNKNIDKERNSVLTENISDDEQMDVSENNRKQQSKATLEASSNIERNAETNKNIDKEGNSVSTGYILDGEQMDVTESSREQQSDDVVEASSNINGTVSADLEVIDPVLDAVNTKTVGTATHEVMISHATDRLLGDESSGDTTNIIIDRNIKGAVPETIISSDHDIESTKVKEMNNILTSNEQGMIENEMNSKHTHFHIVNRLEVQ